MLPRHGDDGGLDTDIGLAAVENQRQTAIHIGQRVRRIRRAGLAGKVCRRRGKRDAAGLDDLLHHRVGRHPHADGVKARAGHVADLGAAGHDHRQRAGPEGGSQLFGTLGHLGDDAVQHLHAADMHNERVILRAALRFKNFLDGLAVAGVGGNAVDRLRRQGDQLTLLQKPGGQCHALRRDGPNLCFHSSIFLLLYCFASVFLPGLPKSAARPHGPGRRPAHPANCAASGRCGDRSRGPAGSCRCVSFRCGHRC